jgi:hypothetical protein
MKIHLGVQIVGGLALSYLLVGQGYDTKLLGINTNLLIFKLGHA